jgi:hypothetical protein
MRGTFVLTDRNLYFTAGRNEILVVPLASVSGVENVAAQARTLGMGVGFGRPSDNALALTRCEVRRVPLDPDIDAQTGNDATALKSLFVLADALGGMRVPTIAGAGMGLDAAAAAASADASSSSSAAAAAAAAAALVAEVCVRPSLTFIFSAFKDLLVSRGDERKTGGRRQVVRTALDELVAAHKLAAEY